jgi:hypothetical protein
MSGLPAPIAVGDRPASGRADCSGAKPDAIDRHDGKRLVVFAAGPSGVDLIMSTCG